MNNLHLTDEWKDKNSMKDEFINLMAKKNKGCDKPLPMYQVGEEVVIDKNKDSHSKD